MYNPSPFLGHEPCPKCTARGEDTRGDNMGRWQDGHAYCFNCKYTIYSPVLQQIQTAAESHMKDISQIEGNVKKKIQLPNDLSATIPAKALQWLDKYGIMRDEIIEFKLKWSEFYQWLVFPVYNDSKELILFQARQFGPNDKSRWLTFGEPSKVLGVLGMIRHQGKTHDDMLVIVEDLVSAIKVARHQRAMALFGSSLPLEKFLKLKRMEFTPKIIFWLDQDKYPEAMGMSARIKLLGHESTAIFTPKDPKEYDDDIIKNLVRA